MCSRNFTVGPAFQLSSCHIGAVSRTKAPGQSNRSLPRVEKAPAEFLSRSGHVGPDTVSDSGYGPRSDLPIPGAWPKRLRAAIGFTNSGRVAQARRREKNEVRFSFPLESPRKLSGAELLLERHGQTRIVC